MVLRDLRLGAKQTVGFGIILLIMAGANFYSLSRLASLNDEIGMVTGNSLPRVVAISGINLSTSELRTNQLQYAIASGEESRLEHAANIIELLNTIEHDLDTYQSLKRSSQERNSYSEKERLLYEEGFDPQWEEYLDLSLSFLTMSDSDRNQTAVELLGGEARKLYDSFSADLEELVKINRENSLDAAQRAERTFNDARHLIISLLVGTLVISIAVAFGLVRFITVPVQELEKAAYAVAEGNLDVRVDIQSKDEIGSLAQSFNQMTASLQDAQQQLVMKEKMASLGNLVAGVAHEINNPIGAMHSAATTSSTCIDRLTETLETSSDLNEATKSQGFGKVLQVLRSNTDVALMASERIGSIVQSLKNFARLDEAEFQNADLHEGLESTLTLLDHMMKNRIEIVREYGELPEILCYPSQINQVFMNVLSNASQAIEGRGTITINTSRDADNAYVKISDSGLGISAEDIPQIFDPGFTTKGVGVGTGLGLSISYNILEKHGGTARVNSVVGKGTDFTIALPLVPANS